MKISEKIDLIKYRRDKAFETLKDIEILIGNNLLLLAMNRIYYAGFYIVSALLLFEDFSTSKHKQLIGYFNRNYIRNNLISIEIGEVLNKAFMKRTSVDYGDFVTVTKTEVIEYFEKIKIFVAEVDKLIQERMKNILKAN
ncbi:MAG: HEPN domain-containing protein [Bacteroidetes bacterium]|nr:HEPN domain-containing protein [Bacteroidota bacterium]MBU2583718.1 HEPN domain-containing protein [Bacteroidota bacterium]